MTSISSNRIAVRAIDAPNGASTFAMSEFEVRLPRAYDDPFDPNQIRVDATVRVADKTLVVPAFWFEPVDGGEASFWVRVAPPTAGAASIVVTATDSTGVAVSEVVRFEVAPSAGRGFVRRAANDRYHRLDAGDGLFLVGPNLAWPNQGGVATYERWFATLAANGGNFARVWLCHPNRPTESAELGLGRCDASAYDYYDAILAAAQLHGIYLMLCFMNHRDLLVRDMWGDAQWPNSPYNAANGGPCETPQSFITSPVARACFKRRLRYSIARFGAFTSVAFWEFWNEQDFAGVDVPAEWTLEMAQFIRDLDPHARGITNSFGMGYQSAVWASPLIDMTTHHAYPGEAAADATPAIVAFHRTHDQFRKPSWMGEIGIDHRFGDQKLDPAALGTNMHNAHWASLAAGGCATAGMWWWDQYIDAKDLWPVYRGIGAFARTIDWATREFAPFSLSPARLASTSSARRDAELPLLGRSNRESETDPIAIDEAGRASRALPGTLYGLHDGLLATPLRLALAGPTPAAIRIGTHEVGVSTRLRIRANGVEVNTLHLEPDSTPRVDEVALPSTTRELDLEIVSGGNAAISSLTLCDAVPAVFPPLDLFALRCSASGDWIVWVKDQNSNWRADREGRSCQTHSGVTLSLPLNRVPCIARWVDTRTGDEVAIESIHPTSEVTTIHIPAFARDIVLHVQSQPRMQ